MISCQVMCNFPWHILYLHVAHSAPTESKSKALAASARLSALEDDKAALQQSLAGERDALASARQSVARLQRDLSELQAVSTAAASLAATDKASIEREEDSRVSVFLDLEPWAGLEWSPFRRPFNCYHNTNHTDHTSPG